MADMRRRRSRPWTSTVTEIVAAVSAAPRAITSVAPRANQAPVTSSSPRAAGGWSMSWTATTASAPNAIAGIARPSSG